MARSIWNGLLNFGLVSIPIKLFSATSDKDIHFNQLHSKCKNKINQIKKCKACNEELNQEDIVKGYEFAKGQFVVITENDLTNLHLITKKLIAVSQFIDVSELDAIHYEKTYYLEPSLAAEKPFALMVKTLQEKNKAALCKFTLRTKERLCLIRARGNHLLLTTLLYPDEITVSDGKDFDLPNLSEQEVTMGGMIVDMMTKPFVPSEVEDNYRQALVKVIESKLSGQELVTPVEPDLKPVDNLMDALMATVKAMKEKA